MNDAANICISLGYFQISLKKIIDSKRITIYRKMEALIQQIKFSIIFELNSAINKYYANGII